MKHTILLTALFLVQLTVFAQYEQKREQMVNQLKEKGIKDPKVINAMLKVPRHEFVPAESKSKAYDDVDVSIGYGQSISKPYLVALMTELLKLKQSDKVLEVGTGLGYHAAVLSEMCDSVFTIEIMSVLAKEAKNKFTQLNYHNIYVKIGDGYKGWKKYAPYDAIIVSCAPSHIPQPLIDQLSEGGKMIIPVGNEKEQKLILLHKINNKMQEQDIVNVNVQQMLGKRWWRYNKY